MEKIWLQQYPEHVPEQVDCQQYNSLVELFEDVCEKYAAKPAFQNYGEQISYAQMAQYSLQFATFLQQHLQLKPGSRVAIILPNCLQYPITLFAILRAGLVAVNINPLYTANEIRHLFQDAEPEAVVVFANIADTVAQAVKNTSVKHLIVTELGDLFHARKRYLFNWTIKFIKRLVPKFSFSNSYRFRHALQLGKKYKFNRAAPASTDLALLQYTGGTTGKPKGAMLSHGNLVANVLQIQAWMKPVLVVGKEVAVSPLPLYHIFSFTTNCLMFLLLGCLNILVTDPRDIKNFTDILIANPFTIITGVNTLYNALLHHPEFSTVDFSTLKLSIGGGMPIQQWVAEHWHQLTGSQILEGYGLTEASPVVTVNPVTLTEFNGSIGLPIPSTHISIRDDDGEEVGLNEPGELWVQGPQVMQGYWNKPDETAKVLLANGWLRTGDIATLDDKGFVRIVDRVKDMILVSGFNVYPNEVEAVITSHPKVMEVGVVGETSRSGSERVSAYVVKSDAELTVSELLEYSREHLAAYKVPKKVTFVESLPKSHVGKILRRKLKDMQS